MFSRALFLGVLFSAGGCVFTVGALDVDEDTPDLGAADLAAGEPDLSVVDLATPDLLPPRDLRPPPDLAIAFCAAPGVIACYEFEDGATSTVAHDGTPHHDDLTLTNAVVSAPGYSGSALQTNNTSLAHCAHSTTFDVAQLTIEMWIKPSALPSGGARMGLLDEDGQWGLFIYSPGVLTCSLAAQALSSGANQIVTDQWQHVACTYDKQWMRLYYNGVQIAMLANTNALATNQPNGLSVGANSPSGDAFDGKIDQVRVFNEARSAAELCEDGAGPGCAPFGD